MELIPNGKTDNHTFNSEAPRACLPQAGTAWVFTAMIYYYIVPLDPGQRAGLAGHPPVRDPYVSEIRIVSKGAI